MPKFELKGPGLENPPVPGWTARLRRLREGHYLVTCEADEREQVESQLDSLGHEASSSGAAAYHVPDVTSVYASLLLAGPKSTNVLRKLIDLEISEATLPNLHAVQTGLAHVFAIVLRDDIDALPAYYLLAGREYGEWLWDTVLHAGKEFGMTPFGLAAHGLLVKA
jgi:glycine cleavage system aminomethyltransferase T